MLSMLLYVLIYFCCGFKPQKQYKTRYRCLRWPCSIFGLVDIRKQRFWVMVDCYTDCTLKAAKLLNWWEMFTLSTSTLCYGRLEPTLTHKWKRLNFKREKKELRKMHIAAGPEQSKYLEGIVPEYVSIYVYAPFERSATWIDEYVNLFKMLLLINWWICQLVQNVIINMQTHTYNPTC